MTNWENLHPDFKNNPELIKKWTDRGFTYQRVERWANILGRYFDSSDYDWFENSIKELKKKGEYGSPRQMKQLLNNILEEAKKPLKNSEITEICVSEETNSNKEELKSELINEIWTSEEADLTNKTSEKKGESLRKNWKGIHSNFTSELQKEWEEKGFSYEECKEWIDIGLTINDIDYCYWLREAVGLTPIQVLNESSLERELRKMYYKYGHLPFFWEQSKSLYSNFTNILEKVACGQCSKEIGNKNNGFFSDTEKGLDFCSEECYSKWNSEGNWLDIHPNFTLMLKKEWKKKGFSYEKCKEWFNAGLQFSDIDYICWLKNIKKKSPKEVSHEWQKELKTEYQEYKEWADIDKDFSGYWGNKTQSDWKNLGFTPQTVKPWLEVGVVVEDCNFTSYLRDVKKVNPQWVMDNKHRKDYKEMRGRCNFYDWCRQCQQINISENWCQSCAEKQWEEDLKHLSGQQLIEKFIKQQEKRGVYSLAHDEDFQREKIVERILRWIPYEEFFNIEYLAEGGFSVVFKACWKRENKKPQGVVLKILNTSQNITLELLTEIANSKLVDVDNDGYFVNCCGISQDPETKSYVIVMDYIEGGNLRQFLQKKYQELSWEDKFEKLCNIVMGLSIIHTEGLVHRDFHPGNILKYDHKKQPPKFGNVFISCCITDLGLSKPVDTKKDNKKIFGVLPYVAPEVLREKKYTQASDVYSFAMVSYELFSGLSPYHNMVHDQTLMEKICEGLRPNLDKVKAPQLLKDLISRCWDANPLIRPTSNEIWDTVRDWKDKKSEEFNMQLPKSSEMDESEVEKTKKNQSSIVSYSTVLKFHPQVIYTSRLLDFPNLPQPQNNPSQEWQNSTLLELRIKSIIEQINLLKNSLNNELKELVEQFIEIKKKSIKNEELKSNVWNLEDELEQKGLSKEKIDELARCCEDLVELEQQEQNQVQIQQPPK